MDDPRKTMARVVASEHRGMAGGCEGVSVKHGGYRRSDRDADLNTDSVGTLTEPCAPARSGRSSCRDHVRTRRGVKSIEADGMKTKNNSFTHDDQVMLAKSLLTPIRKTDRAASQAREVFPRMALAAILPYHLV